MPPSALGGRSHAPRPDQAPTARWSWCITRREQALLDAGFRDIFASAKGKENLTGVLFKHLENDPAEMAARAKVIAESLKK